ncbi:hypothetical protein AC1031_003817 [Aphanomyces cochlioides]|nr:hypothetical protein AC1031_003817 [Aphanomyces cochlioides]
MDKSSPEYKEAVREHAKTLGLDPDKEPQYLWIVEEALSAPLPPNWEQGETDDGTIYYFNSETDESIWEHPMDSHYSEMIKTKRAEDAAKKAAPTAASTAAAVFNNAPKQQPASSAIQAFSLDDADDDDVPTNTKQQPKSQTEVKKPATTTTTTTSSTTKAVGFGKDSQSWLLDDEDDFPTIPTTKPSIVSAIKKQDDVPKAAVFIKQATPVPTISPVPATSSVLSHQMPTQPAPAVAVNHELEKQVETLKAEITQLKKERDANEKAERQVKTSLQQQVDSLRRGKEQAEVEAKESNYLRMKVNELKAKVTALETKKDGADSSILQSMAEVEAKLDAARRELDAKAQQVNQLMEKLAQVQADCDRQLKKKEEELAMKIKEHSIEIEELKDQLLMRQATNITLQNSATDLDRWKKKATELEDEVRRVQGQLTELTTSTADMRATFEAKEKKITLRLDAQVNKLAACEKELSSARQQLLTVEKERDEHAKAVDLRATEKTYLEQLLEQTKAELQNTKTQLDDASKRIKTLEESSWSATNDAETVKRAHERELKMLQDKVVEATQERDDAEARIKRQKEEHVHLQSKWQLDLEELRRDKERSCAQTTEVQALRKEIESLNIDLARVRDQKTTTDHELRNLKQAMSLETSQLMQCKAQIEDWVRKEFLEKQRLELLTNEKSGVEKKVMTLEAQLQTMRSEFRTETDKYLFRIRELESLNARYEYDLSRADEKFATAEKWRLKEASRVDQRDADILDLKEELGRLKARNIDGENNHVINELRAAAKTLDVQVKELKGQLQEEVATKSQIERQRAQEIQLVKKQMESQLPQLAAAATQRASDEWRRRCDEIVGKIKAEFEESWLLEKQKSTEREAAWHDEKRELEREIKTHASEKDFLNKEVSRLEDNNKHLIVRHGHVDLAHHLDQEQLHTIRVYLTQRPVHSAMAPMYAAPSQPPCVNPEVVGSQQLQNQLGILHAQFQQLFQHSAQPPPSSSRPPPPPPRFERQVDPTERSSRVSSVEYTSPSSAQLLDEKKELIRSMEALGGDRNNDWVPLVDTAAVDGNNTWYRKGYWRSKYS